MRKRTVRFSDSHFSKVASDGSSVFPLMYPSFFLLPINIRADCDHFKEFVPFSLRVVIDIPRWSHLTTSLVLRCISTNHSARWRICFCHNWTRSKNSSESHVFLLNLQTPNILITYDAKHTNRITWKKEAPGFKKNPSKIKTYQVVWRYGSDHACSSAPNTIWATLWSMVST